MSPRKRKATTEPVFQIPENLPIAAARLADSFKSNAPVITPTAIPNDGDFVRGSKWTPVRQTKAYEAACWLYSPARLELLAEASDALVSVATVMGLPDEKITEVEVILQKSTKTLFIRPRTDETEEYYDVKETSNEYLSINIRSLLQPNNLEVRRGYQQRHKVVLDLNSMVGPALVIDLTKKDERRTTAAKRRAQKAKGATDANNTDHEDAASGQASAKATARTAAKSKSTAARPRSGAGSKADANGAAGTEADTKPSTGTGEATTAGEGAPATSPQSEATKVEETK